MGRDSSICEFLRDKTVFVTGGTGFVGLALIEKLLRTTEVKQVLLLMRPKKGKAVEERLEELTKNPVFERLMKEKPVETFSRLRAVAGDVSEEKLGLSDADETLLASEVEVAFHSAATLDFQTPLKPTVQTNLLGTRRVIVLCQKASKLQVLVHVSSAYVNSDKRDVEEVLYPHPCDVEEVIKAATTLSDEAADEITPKLLGALPNPYTLTKNLAEQEVAKANRLFPAAIVRPSMITAAWKEPIPGWTCSKNGPTGFMLGASKGVVRRLPANPELVTDYIPVDIVVNGLLAAAWYSATNRPDEVQVYHATSSTCNPFRWGLVQDHVNAILHKYPLRSAVWYPHLKLLPSLLLFRISALFVHMIPAYILDAVTRLAGGRPILVRLHTNVNSSLKRLAPFIFTEWFFRNEQALRLHGRLRDEDRQTFGLDISALRWDSYFVDLAQGVRRYLNNEMPSTLPAARRKDNILMVAHLGVQALVYALIWWAVARVSGSSFTHTGWVVIVSYLLFGLL